MFVFDVETLGKTTDTVILSMACIYFNPLKNTTLEEMYGNAFFAKFKVRDQIERLGRTTTKSTMQWWNKQCDIVKTKSFLPSKNDIIIDDGIEMMREWSKQFPNNEKDLVWARGNLDQLVLDSIEEQLEIKPVFFFSRWRDVRTYIDMNYGTIDGYCKVNYPNFNPAHHIIKHDPVDDCVYDAMMMLYGVNNEID